MWISLFPTMALAGTLTVEANRPCLVILDGQPLEFLEGRMAIEADDLEAGKHHLEIRNLGGRRITELEVEVGHEESVRVTYGKRLLTVAERSGPQVEEAPPPAPRVEEETHLADLDDPEITGPDAGAPVAVGSFQLVAPATASVRFDGEELEFSTASESFTATELVPGSYPLRIEHDGRLLFKTERAVEAGRNQRCLLSGEDLACEAEEPQLGLPFVAADAVDVPVAELVQQTAPEQFEGPVAVTIRPADPLDLSSVFLDGGLLYKVRRGTSSHTTELTRGAHVLEVRGFDDQVWVRGKLDVGGQGDLVLTFDDDGTVTTNRDTPETWTNLL